MRRPRQLRLCQCPQALLYRRAGRVARHGKHPAQHPLHVAIQNGRTPPETEHGNGRRRRTPHPRQGLQRIRRIRKHAPLRRHLLRGCLQVAGPAVIAQPSPQAHHPLGRGSRQIGNLWKGLQEGLEIRNDRADLRLLQHHLRQPHPVGIAQHGRQTGRRGARLIVLHSTTPFRLGLPHHPFIRRRVRQHHAFLPQRLLRLLPGQMVPPMHALPAHQVRCKTPSGRIMPFPERRKPGWPGCSGCPRYPGCPGCPGCPRWPGRRRAGAP